MGARQTLSGQVDREVVRRDGRGEMGWCEGLGEVSGGGVRDWGR